MFAIIFALVLGNAVHTEITDPKAGVELSAIQKKWNGELEVEQRFGKGLPHPGISGFRPAAAYILNMQGKL